MTQKTFIVPADGQWHRAPEGANGIEAPTTPTVQLDIDLENGVPIARNIGPEPVELRYV